MKRFLSLGKRNSVPPPAKVPTAPPPNPVVSQHPGLQPAYTVPPVPHPCPYEYIAILVTPQGLLLRPHVPGVKHPESHVRIGWGKDPVVEELTGDGSDSEDADWSRCMVVYGIVGILKMFTASYLLVISAREDMGCLLNPSYPVYGVKSVSSIPLREEGAKIAVENLYSRNAAISRPSLLPMSTQDAVETMASSELADEDREGTPIPSSPHVKFSDTEQVKLMTPLNTQEFPRKDDGSPSPPSSPTSISSNGSTPSSETSDPNNSVAKILANRLSFWNKIQIPKRMSVSPATTAETTPLTEDEEPLEADLQDAKADPGDTLDSIINATAPAPATAEEKHTQLEEKVVRETIREFSKAMYFAHHFDITRSLQAKQTQILKTKKQNELLADLNALDEKTTSPIGDKIDIFAEPHPTLPLWRRVDRQFWWNEWLSKPFIDAGLHSYVLPIMQGYYQASWFHIPREPVQKEEGDAAFVDYIIVSRRSRERAGLRYQRRGVDDEANVANFVETETIMKVEREGIANIFSYVQIRGSIPLFWSQPGYSLKPAPVLSPDRTHEQNLDALRRHFEKTVSRYGPNVAVNLAEQHGKEASVSNAYRDYMTELKWKEAQYNEYDFHTETRGMKYENISKLINRMERTFDSQGYLWISNDQLMSEQKGVFRVNCIDCLDRTNVVESAFARHVLDKQLGAVALLNEPEGAKTETDVVFNDVWANNGDQISRVYAGTSALKGDFTRTGKRDIGGMLNDGVNSLARMYTSTFSDWFCQAVIDYMLGYRTLTVFSEFLLKLQSSDPRDLIRLSKIRAEAVADSVSRVLPEGESLLSGWTLFSPLELNTKISRSFEEKVVLLSVKALYIVSYDYTLEKVKMYTRVPLGDIIGISKGSYILSPLEETSRDPLQNAGFVVTWLNTNQDTRVTSYSVRNNVDVSSAASSSRSPFLKDGFAGNSRQRKESMLSRVLTNAAAEVGSTTSFAAFKALPIDPTHSRRDTGSFEPADELTGAATCKDVVDLVVDAVVRACSDVGGAQGNFVTEADVVSLAEAQRMTSIYTKMEYGLKRLLWLGG